jgi:hypothetical protein
LFNAFARAETRIVWRLVRDIAHALLLAILDEALAQKRARAIRLKHIFVD